MRVLVTGGAGFIGSTFVRHLLETSDDSITILDALTYAGHRATIAELVVEPRVSFVHADICDREAVKAVLPGHDAVVHLAAESHVDRSLLDPDVFVRTNCDGTNVLCDVAVRAGVDRFVHVSTDEVYGSIDEGSFVETDALAPSSPYSASKAGSDLLALAHHETHGLPVLVTRSSNQYGPYQFPEKLIPLFVTNLLDGRRVPLYGDGCHIRDWLFVRDNCEAIDLVLRSGEVGGIYNIGGGDERTNREVAALLVDLLGAAESSIEHVEDRPGHDRRYSICSDRIAALGWSPSTSFEEGLVETIEFYRSRREWWQPLRDRVRNR